MYAKIRVALGVCFSTCPITILSISDTDHYHASPAQILIPSILLIHLTVVFIYVYNYLVNYDLLC